jgi:hypothetical protein
MKYLLIFNLFLLANTALNAVAQQTSEAMRDCAGVLGGNAILTDCGCNEPASRTFACLACGDNTSCLDCAGTPFGNRTPEGPSNGVISSEDPCSLICPPGESVYTPTNLCRPTVEICQEVDQNLILASATYYHPKREPKSNVMAGAYKNGVAYSNVGEAYGNTCLAQVIDACSQKIPRKCTEWGDPKKIGKSWKPHCDEYESLEDATLDAVRTRGGNDDGDNCLYEKFLELGLALTNKTDDRYNRDFFNGSYRYINAQGYVTVDEDGKCKKAPQELVERALDLGCTPDEIEVVRYSSPVSLLWTHDVDIKHIISFSDFPLDGKREDAAQLFQWRASGMTPLVVYDKSGTGIITDATQLFGNHTFGKKWKNGYEALASLDSDANGWLEKGELAHTALWFDFNQDGASQPGEVKQLADVGIYAIGVKSDPIDEKSRDIYASNGFKRTVDGQEYIGRSVDWFGGVAKGRITQMQKPITQLDKNPRQQDKQKINPKGSDVRPVRFDPAKDVSGIWHWRITDDKMLLPEQQPGGFFVFTQEDKKIRGQSLSTLQFRPNTFKINEHLTSLRIAGTLDSNGIVFEVAGDEKPRAITHAKLSANGFKLVGETKETVPVKGGTVTYTFGWEARRYGVEKTGP